MQYAENQYSISPHTGEELEESITSFVKLQMNIIIISSSTVDVIKNRTVKVNKVDSNTLNISKYILKC